MLNRQLERTPLARLRRLVREARSTSWAADRALQTLPPDACVVVVTDDPAAVRPDLALLRSAHPSVRVETLAIPPEADERALTDLHARLRLVPEPLVLVSAVRSDTAGEALLRQCLYYLRDNGIWFSVGDPGRTRAQRALLERLHRIQRSPGFDPAQEASPLKVGPIAMRNPDGAVATERLAAAVRSVRFKRTRAVVRTRGSRLLKVHESDMTDQLVRERRLSWVHAVTDRHGFSYASPTVAHLNHERFRYRFKERFDAPDLVIREYEEVVCQRRQIVFRDGLLLPDTFRLTGQAYLRTSVLQDVDRHFARPAKQPAPGRLEGAYYYLDTEYPNVYGHLLTDMVGRLWGWQEVKAAHPEVKLLLSDRAATGDLPAWCRTTLNAYGIADEDIVLLHAPMRVERLFAVTPQFVNYEHGYAHPALAEVWGALGSALRARASLEDPPKKLFISRPRDNNRLCRNHEQVEGWFRDRGFAVVRPERFSVPDQAVLFERPEAVAGYGGSGMLGAVYAAEPARRLVINPWSYHALNEYLISTVHGEEITYLYQQPEITAPTPEFPRGGFHSPYTVDLEADHPLLAEFADR